MSKQANPKLIGGFVLGAVVLMVAGVLVFGSGRFLKERREYVLFFDSSLQGLNVGALVQLKGVTIGAVKDIKLLFNPDTVSFRTPVYIEVEPGRVSAVAGDGLMKEVMEEIDIEKIVDIMVEQRGLRAQLQLQSLVTSKLLVEFDFHPGTPVNLIGLEKEYKELPTIPTDIQTLTRELRKLQIEDLVSDVRQTIVGIRQLMNSPELAESIRSLNETLQDFGKLARNMDGRMVPLATSIDETMKDAQKLVRNIDGQLPPLASRLKDSLEATRSTMEQAKKTLATGEDMAGDDSTLHYILTETLLEVAAAARSIRVIADYLERNPEALLQGKGQSGGK